VLFRNSNDSSLCYEKSLWHLMTYSAPMASLLKSLGTVSDQLQGLGYFRHTVGLVWPNTRPADAD